MTDDSDDDLFLTPPSSPVIQPFEGNESLDLAQWKLEVLCRAYEKVESRKKELELEEKRTMALLSKVSLKLQKSSRSSNEHRANQSSLGVRTKPTIAKKYPDNVGSSSSKPKEQHNNTPQISTSSQAKGSLPVLLSPVLVRKLPPYNNNHLARRIECSEQADDLYKQLVHHLDSGNERTRQKQQKQKQQQKQQQQQQQQQEQQQQQKQQQQKQQQQQQKQQQQQQQQSTITESSPSHATIASGLPSGASPSDPYAISARNSAVTPPRPTPHPTYFFQNQLPTTIPSNNWSQPLGYNSDHQYSNYPYHSNNNNTNPPSGPYQAHGSNSTYNGQSYHAPGNSWNSQHFLPFTTTTATPNLYSPSPPPPAASSMMMTWNPSQQKWKTTHVASQGSAPAPALVPVDTPHIKKGQSPPPSPANKDNKDSPSSLKWQPVNSNVTRPPAPPIHANDDKKPKDSYYQPPASISIAANTNHPPQPSPKFTTPPSSTSNTLKKQQLPSPANKDNNHSASTLKWRPIKSNVTHSPASPIYANDDKQSKDSHHQSPSSISTVTNTNHPSQPNPKFTTHSSSTSNTLKKQNYQSPLETFGINPEQSSTTIQKNQRVDRPLCVFEAEGGTCNDDTCHSMHFRDF